MTAHAAGIEAEAKRFPTAQCKVCSLGKGRTRYCEVLERELPKDCCICIGGHDCRWWDLCEASQGVRRKGRKFKQRSDTVSHQTNPLSAQGIQHGKNGFKSAHKEVRI